MFKAHISEDKQRNQSIQDHLAGTAQLAEEFASAFACGSWGYGCGMIHDIGKYSKEFQRRLEGGPKVDHATAGARELWNRRNVMGSYCIAGHHSGLPDGGTPVDGAGEATLQGRMKKPIPDYQAFHSEIKIPAFTDPPLRSVGSGGFSVSFWIRMLFSCLVDADYLDTEQFMRPDCTRDSSVDAGELEAALLRGIDKWLGNTDLQSINGRRTAILKACLEKATEEPGIFRLTVPTGGGKTIASLAFALRHSKIHGLRRVIYVIPYTNIISQTAQTFKELLGSENVLEDHSNVIYESEEEWQRSQLAAENWDKPVIVTTNVQFFESLFANRSSKCRKLHNIAGSVVIFDEAQMIPVNLIQPCMRAIEELTVNYHCTAVLCTATQPSVQSFFMSAGSQIREICPRVNEQFEFFKRTTVRHEGSWAEETLAQRLKQETRALCIVNNRKRAQRIYETLAKEEGIFHLSTLMYPAHRLRLLNQIKSRLRNRQRCIVIATSLVEAGVDLDFQTVYRELAGLDSVIQAAGRCNREGKEGLADCQTIVFQFEKEDGFRIPRSLALPCAITERIFRQYADVTSPEAIEAYFTQLYQYRGIEGLDDQKIVQRLEAGIRSYSFPFATIASQFHLINEQTIPILIDREEEAKEIVERIRRKEYSRQLTREAGRYCVGINPTDFEALNGVGLLEAVDVAYYCLRDAAAYSEEKGLCLDAARGDAVFG